MPAHQPDAADGVVRTTSNPGETRVPTFTVSELAQGKQCSRRACSKPFNAFTVFCKGPSGGDGCPANSAYCSVDCRLKDWAVHKRASPVCSGKQQPQRGPPPPVTPRGQARRPPLGAKPPLPPKPRGLQVGRKVPPRVLPKPQPAPINANVENNPPRQQPPQQPNLRDALHPARGPAPPDPAFNGHWFSEAGGEDPLHRLIEINCGAGAVSVDWHASSVPFEHGLHVQNEESRRRNGGPSVELDTHPVGGHPGMRWAFQLGGDPGQLNSRSWSVEHGEAAIDKAAVDLWRRVDAEQAARLGRMIGAINAARARIDAAHHPPPVQRRAQRPGQPWRLPRPPSTAAQAADEINDPVPPIAAAAVQIDARLVQLEQRNAALERELKLAKLELGDAIWDASQRGRKTRALEQLVAEHERRANRLEEERKQLERDEQQRREAQRRRLEARKRDCGICAEGFDLGDGVTCGGPDVVGEHFLCAECLGGHVREESTLSPEKPLGDLCRREGNVFCPFAKHGCGSTVPYHDREIACAVSAEVFKIYNDAKKQVVEAKLVGDVAAAERARFEAELKKIEQMSEEQRIVYRAQQDVENLAFVEKCPRCSAPYFYDRGGAHAHECAALYCGQCQAGFCAWCQLDCGNDAHNHLHECPEVPAGVDATFPDPQQVKEVQDRRKARLVAEYLRKVPNPQRRAAVAQACVGVLRDLGLEAEFVGNGGAGGGDGAAAAAGVIRARVMFDYESQDDDELTIAEGDIVTVPEQIDEGWWLGELRGASGLFPANFVMLI